LSHLLKNLDVIVNGSAMELPAGITIRELLEHLRINTGMVAVELNHEIVPRIEHPMRRISTGDQIEIVHFVGGG
jgi:sulfur carrier protein